MGIGIRAGPDVTASRTGGQLLPGQVFEVAELIDAPDGVQRYLRLSNGSGWAFTHSMKDGRLLAEEVSEEQAKNAQPAGGMHAMMQLLQDPQAMAQLFSQQSQNPLVNEAMAARPNVANAVNADPAAFANDL